MEIKISFMNRRRYSIRISIWYFMWKAGDMLPQHSDFNFYSYRYWLHIIYTYVCQYTICFSSHKSYLIIGRGEWLVTKWPLMLIFDQHLWMFLPDLEAIHVLKAVSSPTNCCLGMTGWIRSNTIEFGGWTPESLVYKGKNFVNNDEKLLGESRTDQGEIWRRMIWFCFWFLSMRCCNCF